MSQLIDGLSASKLAKSICSHFRGKVAAAHETFEHALRRLELHHSGRMKQNESQRDTIRKVCSYKCDSLMLLSYYVTRTVTLCGSVTVTIMEYNGVEIDLQGVVTLIRTVEPSATGIKISD